MDRLIVTYGSKWFKGNPDTFHCGQCGTEMGYLNIYEKEDRMAIFLEEGVLTGKNITHI